MKKKKLQDLALGERAVVGQSTLQRVPGGWVRDYKVAAGFNITSVFIPYSTDYAMEEVEVI